MQRTVLQLCALLAFGSSGSWACAQSASGWMGMDRSMLQIAIEFASEGPAARGAEREEALDRLYWELVLVNTEQIFADEVLSVRPELPFTEVVAPEGTTPIDYLFAAHRSLARRKSAEDATDRDWMSRHHTAAKRYLVLAAEGLRREAAENDDVAAKLRTQRFAMRRPADEAERVLAELTAKGLSEEHRKLMTDRGLTPDDIAAYQKKLQRMPAAQLGMSMVELHEKIADARRRLAASLEGSMQHGGAAAKTLGETFVAGNPMERESVVQLHVRRVAMPPEWTISLRAAESAQAQAAGQLREVEKGRRYEVRLPAGGQIGVVTEVVPVGVVAENTTARWAVEGFIGGELVGGVVQEVNVPGFLPDLQLPPIANVPQPAPGAPPAAARPSRVTLLFAAAGVLLVIAAALLLLRRRKRA